MRTRTLKVKPTIQDPNPEARRHLTAPAAEPTRLKVQIPRKLAFLMEMHPYKIAHGGRVGMKTESFARALVSLASNQKLRVLCAREIQKSITESVHATIKAVIEELGLEWFFTIKESAIVGRNGSEFLFHGLHGQTVLSIKSMAHLDIVWVEEAQSVSKRSWDILLPTMREENCEVWISFNPDLDTDNTWVRFIENPPPGAVIAQTNWRDTQRSGWWNARLEAMRAHDERTMSDDDYQNIWEGKPRVAAAGAIYAREVTELVVSRRWMPLPYDPRLPVHRIWDLGWNDAMAIIMVQKITPTAINIVNYVEDRFRTYASYMGQFQRLPYRWGTDWMPHDAEQTDPKSGTNAKKMMEGFGCKVELVPKTGDEPRIRAARMLFPRVYVNKMDDIPWDTGFFGTNRLMECLKRFKRSMAKNGDENTEPGRPVDNQHTHGADAWGGLAEIAHRIKNDDERKPGPRLAAFSSTVHGTGLLG